MKRLSVSLFVFLFAASSFAQLSERFYVVKIYDHVKTISYEVKSTSELKELDKHCKTEAKYWSKAFMQAQKEWKTIEGNERITFPRSCASPMKYKKAGIALKTLEEAQVKAEKYTERLGDAKCCGCGRKGKGGGGGCGGGGNRNSNPKSAKRKADRKKAAAEEKVRIYSDARELLESKLADLMTPVESSDG